MMMDHDELVGKFAQSVGIEKATDMVENAVENVGLEHKSVYEGGEVCDVCDVIRDTESGYLRLLASEIRIHVQAQKRFGVLLEDIPDPAVVVSFDGVDPVVDTVNTAFAETFGYDGTAAGGRSLDELIIPDEDATSAVDAWTASGGSSSREVRRRTADGEVRTFLFRPVVVTREMGEVEGYGIYTDITERERRERKLEYKNEQLERFASVVSHDLRNPLNVAAGQTQLAMDVAEDQAVIDRLESAAAAHERMETLIEELLTLARRGETVGETSPVDLGIVSREAWEGVESGDATLVVESVPTIVADPSRTRELLSNLFQNAVEHGSTNPRSQAPEDAVEHGSTSPDSQARQDAVEHGSTSHAESDDSADAAGACSGEPSVADAPEDAVEHSSTSPDSQAQENDEPDASDGADDGGDGTGDSGVTVYVRELHEQDEGDGFVVEDDGRGIPADERDDIFDHGYSTAESGTGLGLSIVRTIASAHGWEIDLTESDEGGTRFEISGVTRYEP